MSLMIMRRNNFIIRPDIYSFLAFYLNIDMLEDLASSVYMLVLREEAPYIFNIVLDVIGLVILAFIVLRKKSVNRYFFYIALTEILLYIISVVITPDITRILGTSIVRGILYVLIPIYLFTLIDDVDKLFDAFVPYVLIGLIYALIQIPLRSVSFVTDTHYMDFTYNSLIALMMALGIFLFGCGIGKDNRKNKIWYLIVAVVIFAINFVFGGRGVILCAAVAILIWLYFAKANRKVLYFSIVIIIAVVLMLSFDELINMLAGLFPRSRTIVRILNGNFINTTTSVRMKSWTYIISELKNNPFSIRGFLSDRIYLARYLNADSESLYGSYAHNILLEILFQFGAISVPFLVFGIAKVVKSFHYMKNNLFEKSKVICFIVFAFGIGQLSVSASYLTAKSFGMMVGLVLLIDEMSRRKKFESADN